MDSGFFVVEFMSFLMHLLYHNAGNNSTFAVSMLRHYANGDFLKNCIFHPSESITNEKNVFC